MDTSVLLKALITESKVRAIPLNPEHEFFIPDYSLKEVQAHLPAIIMKKGMPENRVRRVSRFLSTILKVVRIQEMFNEWDRANEIIGHIDLGDVPFIAAALAVPCDGIWSDDKHLKEQTVIRVWNTREVIELLSGRKE